MGVSFQDIAREAKVSYATVSRVVNGTATVSPRVEKAVRGAMKKLRYQPPAPEKRRGPRRRALTGQVALLFPDPDVAAMSTPLSAHLAHGIEEVLYAERRNLLLTHLRHDERLPICIEKRLVDGVIVRAGAGLHKLTGPLQRTPCVCVFESDRIPADWDQVLPDNPVVGELACRGLIEQGCRSVAVLNPVPEHLAMIARVAAFRFTAGRAGLEHMEMNGDGVEEVAARFAALESRPDGVFVCGADIETQEVYRAFQRLGIRPFDDVRIIAANHDIRFLRALDPRFPNVSICPIEIGKAAADLMCWRLRNPEMGRRRLLIPPQLDLP